MLDASGAGRLRCSVRRKGLCIMLSEDDKWYAVSLRLCGDSLDPTLSFGPKGEVGVLFGDSRSGSKQVYFTHLECVTGPRPL